MRFPVGTAELSERVLSAKVLPFPRSVRIAHVPDIYDPGVVHTGIEATTPQGAEKQFLWYRNCTVGDLATAAGQERAIELLITVKRYLGADIMLHEPKNGANADCLTRGLYVEAALHPYFSSCMHLPASDPHSPLDPVLEVPSGEMFSRAEPLHYEAARTAYQAHFFPTLFR